MLHYTCMSVLCFLVKLDPLGKKVGGRGGGGGVEAGLIPELSFLLHVFVS